MTEDLYQELNNFNLDIVKNKSSFCVQQAHGGAYDQSS